MKILISTTLAIAYLIMAPKTFADDIDSGSQIHVIISPVIGYQSIERTVPYDHNEGMLTYGGRAVVGTYELAGEFEFLYGSAAETFSNPDLNIDTTFVQMRLGARKVLPIADPVHLIGRAGLEAYKYSNNYTTDAGPSSDSPAWQYRPYLGGGAIFYLFNALSLSVEEIYVVDTSWETDFGFRLFI